MESKRKWKVITHLGEEYAVARSASAAESRVWRRYELRGCERALRQGWRVQECHCEATKKALLPGPRGTEAARSLAGAASPLISTGLPGNSTIGGGATPARERAQRIRCREAALPLFAYAAMKEGGEG